jgi:hypothetical protein
VRAARAAGRIGDEHEAAVALCCRLADELSNPDGCPPSALAGIARALSGEMRALGLVPVASSPTELDALLAELRGE